jgi:hypothetical protein
MNEYELKTSESREVKLKQAFFEIRSIKRSVEFMMEENVYLKNRVSEILSNGFDKKMLGVLEDFQNNFVSEDQLIGLLRNELSQIEELIHREVMADDRAFTELCDKLKRLCKSVTMAESEFIKLKSSFNESLM